MIVELLTNRLILVVSCGHGRMNCQLLHDMPQGRTILRAHWHLKIRLRTVRILPQSVQGRIQPQIATWYDTRLQWCGRILWDLVIRWFGPCPLDWQNHKLKPISSNTIEITLYLSKNFLWTHWNFWFFTLGWQLTSSFCVKEGSRRIARGVEQAAIVQLYDLPEAKSKLQVVSMQDAHVKMVATR